MSKCDLATTVVCFLALSASSGIAHAQMRPEAKLESTTVREFTGHKGKVWSLAFSPNGKTLASGGIDRTVRLWDVATGKEFHQLRGHTAAVTSVAFAPNGQRLASVGNDGATVLWDVVKGALIRQVRAGHDAVAFSSDGATLALGHWGGITAMWDVASGDVTLAPRHVDLLPRFGGISADGKTRISKSGTAINMWDVPTGKESRSVQGYISAVFSPDGTTLIAGGADHSIHLWEVATGKEIHSYQINKERAGFGAIVAFAPDGKSVAGACDQRIFLWTGLPLTAVAPREIDAEELRTLWADLASADATRAYAAIATLAAAPGQSLPYLRDRLPPYSAAPAPDVVARLIANLRSDQFTPREQAAFELEKLGVAVAPAVRKALADKPSNEMRIAGERVLKRILNSERLHLLPEQLRAIRSLQVLERIGTSEARQVLAALAKGAEHLRLTQEAKSAEERLARRSTSSP